MCCATVAGTVRLMIGDDKPSYREVHGILKPNPCRPFAELIANAVPDSTLADAAERGTPDDYVIVEVPVTLGQVLAARRTLGR